MCGPGGSPAFSGTVTPPFVPLSHPFPCHPYMRVRGLCELYMVEQRFVLCAEGMS